MPNTNIYVANQSFTAVVDGATVDVYADITTAEEGSRILDMYRNLFKPLEVTYPARPEVEQATAAPGEKRGRR